VYSTFRSREPLKLEKVWLVEGEMPAVLLRHAVIRSRVNVGAVVVKLKNLGSSLL